MTLEIAVAAFIIAVFNSLHTYTLYTRQIDLMRTMVKMANHVDYKGDKG